MSCGLPPYPTYQELIAVDLCEDSHRAVKCIDQANPTILHYGRILQYAAKKVKSLLLQYISYVQNSKVQGGYEANSLHYLHLAIVLLRSVLPAPSEKEIKLWHFL